jgi:hypothetical protein
LSLAMIGEGQSLYRDLPGVNRLTMPAYDSFKAASDPSILEKAAAGKADRETSAGGASPMEGSISQDSGGIGTRSSPGGQKTGGD